MLTTPDSCISNHFVQIIVQKLFRPALAMFSVSGIEWPLEASIDSHVRFVIAQHQTSKNLPCMFNRRKYHVTSFLRQALTKNLIGIDL